MQKSKTTRWGLFLGWALVTALAWTVALSVPVVDMVNWVMISILRTIHLDRSISQILGMVVFFLLFGALVGIMQWTLLRERARQAWWWVLATALGLQAILSLSIFVENFPAQALGLISYDYGFLPDDPLFTAGLGALLGGFAGVLVGFLQFLALRKQFRRFGWWILASAASWATGFFVLLVFGPTAYHTLPRLLASLLAGMAAGAVGAPILLALLRSPAREATPITADKPRGQKPWHIYIPFGSLILIGIVASIRPCGWLDVILGRSGCAATLEADEERITTLVFSSDGTMLASLDSECNLRVWDILHRTLLWSLSHEDLLTQIMEEFDRPTSMDFAMLIRISENRCPLTVEFLPDGSVIRLAYLFWSIPEGMFLGSTQVIGPFSPDGLWMANGICLAQGEHPFQCQLSTVELVQVPGGEALATLPEMRGRISDLAFSPDGRLLAITTIEPGDEYHEIGRLMVVDIHSRQEAFTLSLPSEDLWNRVAFSPDGTILAYATYQFDSLGYLHGRISLVHTATGVLLNTIDVEEEWWIKDLVISPDNSRLIATDNYLVQIWNIADGTLRHEMTTPWRGCETAISPNGTMIAQGWRFGAIRLWHLQEP